MKLLTKILSFAGLAMTIAPSVLFFMGNLELDSAKNIMAIGMVIWFVTAPFWVNSKA